MTMALLTCSAFHSGRKPGVTNNLPLARRWRRIALSVQVAGVLLAIGIGSGAARAAEGDTKGGKKERTVVELVADARSAGGITKKLALRDLRRTAPRSEADVDALIDLVERGDDRMKSAATEALRNVAPSARHLSRKYIALLDHSTEAIQLIGMQACGKLKAKEAAPKIRQLLAKQPKRKFTKTVAADGERKWDFGGATIETMEFPQAAASALVELNDLDSIDEILSRDEIMAIGSFGGPLVARFGARAIPKALELARRGDSPRSDGARGVISTMRDEEAVPQLIPLLKDSQMAAAAVLALAAMPVSKDENRRLIEDALAAELKNQNEHVRGPAYDGLLRLNSRKYLPQAMEASRSDRQVALQVFYAAIKHRVVDAVPYLEQFIRADEQKNPNWTNERRVAAQAIFSLSGRRVTYKGIERDRAIYPDPYDPNR